MGNGKKMKRNRKGLVKKVHRKYTDMPRQTSGSEIRKMRRKQNRTKIGKIITIAARKLKGKIKNFIMKGTGYKHQSRRR
jgi:hypothetical protein